MIRLTVVRGMPASRAICRVERWLVLLALLDVMYPVVGTQCDRSATSRLSFDAAGFAGLGRV